MQSLYIDLADNPNAMPRPIHLGFSSGVHYLKQHLQSLQTAGINHVALNLRFNQAEIETTLKRLADEVLPHFHHRSHITMSKTLLITGATDGIGLLTARMLVAKGHRVLLHGRDPAKIETVVNSLSASVQSGQVESYVADLSRLSDVEAMAQAVAFKHAKLDVLINNAGVFVKEDPITPDGLDVRFVVNTLAPYLLTKRLMPLLGKTIRVINLSSAAQAPVDLDAMKGTRQLGHGAAYAQSKLALTMWSRSLADSLGGEGPLVVAVNPGSLLASKMVKEAYGMEGKDLRIGADILIRASLDDEFAKASGQYFDNDSRRFTQPHPDALNPGKCEAIVQALESILTQLLA